MAKLTVNQVAALIGKTAYTIKEWYKWYENEDIKRLNELTEQGMPPLPKYEVVGPTKWRYWEEEDIEQLKAFSDWMPHTRNGVMRSLNKKEEK